MNKNEFLKQITLTANGIITKGFQKVAVLNHERWQAHFVEHNFLWCVISRKKAKNEMMKQINISTNEIYQEDFLKVAVLNH